VLPRDQRVEPSCRQTRREEITEATLLLAAAIRAGAATTHGAMALKFFDQA
jgi:hypothetical protein